MIEVSDDGPGIPDAQKAQVTNADKLTAARTQYDKLLGKAIDDALDDLKDEYKDYDETNYTESNWKKLKAAYEDGKTAIRKAACTEEIDKALNDAIKAMKKIAAPIRVELAQFRELQSFAQFGSELDAATKEQLDQGARIQEMLKQPQYQPMPVEKQVVIIYAATKKYLLDIPVTEVLRFEKELFEFIDTKYPEIPEKIRSEKVLSEELEEKLAAAVSEFKGQFELR